MVKIIRGLSYILIILGISLAIFLFNLTPEQAKIINELANNITQFFETNKSTLVNIGYLLPLLEVFCFGIFKIYS